MKQIQTVLIAGAGAIGAGLAWQINKSMPGKVSLLAGGERLERYRETPLIINGTPVSFPLTAVESTSKPDFVIVACKNHHLEQILHDLRNHIGKTP